MPFHTALRPDRTWSLVFNFTPFAPVFLKSNIQSKDSVWDTEDSKGKI